MKRLIPFLALLLVAGCASFSTHMFRTEQTAVNLVFATYDVYTNGLAQGVIHPSVEQSNAIRQARLSFGASVSVAEAWRSAYETNAAVKPQLEAVVTSLAGQASNIVWLVHYLRR